MVYISIRPERHSFEIIRNTGEFVINLTTENLVFQTDLCGVKSGRDLNKFKHLQLTPVKCSKINSYYINESPVNIECVVKEIIPLGSHSMITALVVNILVEDKFIDAKGKFHFNSTKPIVYSHGEYRGLFKKIGKFGFSVEKKKKK
jgi:flavin reductase (DIM6/NTAB) family NADH-FMN oxidoreductase RutF